METLFTILLIIDVILVAFLIGFVVKSLLNKEKVEEKVEEVIAEEVATEEVAVEEDSEDDRDVVKRIPFAQKMLSFDKKTQEYYDLINNTFASLRKINTRISMKGVSYRLGRELVAKITVRGKTMRLHLALSVNDFPQNVYFQRDMSDVKAYVEVPFAVKVKSDRGLRNAVKLIDALVESKGIERKARYNAVDSIAELKDKI